MSDIPEFLTTNPLRDPERVFVVYTRKPIIIAELRSLAAEDDTYTAIEWNNETRYLVALKMDHNPAFLQRPAADQAKRLDTIMRRMGEWYKAYLISHSKP